jgi:hypothetical protein
MVPARPGFIGKLGWVRSSTWDLALLVDREYDAILGRIDIETDDILQLLGKRWTVRQFERADAMWRQLVGFKDALHRAEAHSRRFGEHSAGPVGRLARWRPQRQIEHPLYLLQPAAAACRACASCRASAPRPLPP